VVQYVNKVGEKFYARKKIPPFVLNPPQDSGIQVSASFQILECPKWGGKLADTTYAFKRRLDK